MKATDNFSVLYDNEAVNLINRSASQKVDLFANSKIEYQIIEPFELSLPTR